MKIPKTHPRHTSLMTREKLVKAWKAGVAVPEGLIAHGRGEAWDYLLGEETRAPALVAAKAAAASLVSATRPMISVSAHTPAPASTETVSRETPIPATSEVNLSHRTAARINR